MSLPVAYTEPPVGKEPSRPQEVPIHEGFYICTQESNYHKIGDLVYLTNTSGDRARYIRRKSSYTSSWEEFAANFEFDPAGEEKTNAEVKEIESAIRIATAQMRQETEALRGFNPYISASGETVMALGRGSSEDDEEDEPGWNEPGDALPAKVAESQQAKRFLAHRRNAIQKLGKKIDILKTDLEAILDQRLMVLKAQMAGLMEFVGQAEEAILTLNLYLGADEEIVRLAEGRKAPATEPIRIRQLVLFMDEECAVAAEDGGIDSRHIARFDEWLTEDPAHLDQVLPDKKGIVCMKPRRESKSYSDPWLQDQINKEDKKSYFLIRNGDNLYRIWSSYNVGETLLPTRDEFVKFFAQREFDPVTQEHVTTHLKPGSRGFMEAQKSAAAKERHYMRLGLMLQGLVDRTPIFAPLPGPIDFSNGAHYGVYLQIIADAEGALSDGRERFSRWFTRINAELAKGCRIIGTFSSYEHGLPQQRLETRGGNVRITPSNAQYPPSDALHTIEGKRSGGFYFLYDRTEDLYRRNWRDNGPARVRASCQVFTDDRFFLNFDAVKVADMEYYLESRLDRADYTYLFPVLKLAIKLKKQEAEEEKPFATLLAGQLSMLHGIDFHVAESAVPELIHWWKFKNQTHRALLSEDAKALRMILDEYNLRKRQEGTRNTLLAEGTCRRVADYLEGVLPDLLYVGHVRDNEFVSLQAENAENVFVTERRWRHDKALSGGSIKLAETREWRTVDKRHERWLSIHENARWKQWNIGASIFEHLTDPERLDLVEAVKIEIEKRNQAVEIRYVAAAIGHEGNPTLYYVKIPLPVPPDDLLFTGTIPSISIASAEVRWTRDANRQVNRADLIGGSSYPVEGRLNAWPWQPSTNRDGVKQTLWVESEALEAIKWAEVRLTSARLEARKLRDQANSLVSDVRVQAEKEIDAEEYQKFLAEYGDPDLWEGHKKTRKIKDRIETMGVFNLVGMFLERGIEVTGWSVGLLWQEAERLGFLAAAKSRYTMSFNLKWEPPVGAFAAAVFPKYDPDEK